MVEPLAGIVQTQTRYIAWRGSLLRTYALYVTELSNFVAHVYTLVVTVCKVIGEASRWPRKHDCSNYGDGVGSALMAQIRRAAPRGTDLLDLPVVRSQQRARGRSHRATSRGDVHC
jgi:hypothetical protein